MLSGEVANTNFIVFDPTGLNPQSIPLEAGTIALRIQLPLKMYKRVMLSTLFC